MDEHDWLAERFEAERPHLRVVVIRRGRLFLAIKLTITGEKIARIDVVGDPARLRQLDLMVLDS